MILSRISGGLGNQLFQYALGRALSLRHNTELKFDTHSFGSNQDRSFELQSFNIVGEIATERDFRKINLVNPALSNVLSRVKRKILRVCESHKPVQERRFILEKDFTFDQNILSVGNNAYISGVWQSEKYFKEIETHIRKEITLKNAPSEIYLSLYSKIANSDSISVHIRRGDYISNKKTNSLHGVCPPEYYEAALKEISSPAETKTYFVFSDDISWVKENLMFDAEVVFVSGTGLSNPEELVLMSTCKHNIIANSTFSWWAAWLNTNPKKIVVAPKNWFATTSIDTKDLIPKEWKLV